MQAFDFDSAISWHRSWKMKFHMTLDTIRSGDYDIRPIGDDRQCALGQWLSANAGELGRFASVQELSVVHQEFHRRSESIADAIRKGKILHLKDKAIVEFGVLSERIETLLLQLKAEIRQAG